ncbi:MAG: hypothetical protein Q9182_000406 [Xanthomendoza sp. 2 TL-2023]
MPHTHADKENKPPPPLPPPQSHFQAVFDWSSKPQNTTKSLSTRTVAGVGALTRLDPNSNPAIGTFSSRVAQNHQPIGIWTPIPQVHMPYNNAAIPPSEEVTGSASLPLAREMFISAVSRLDNLEFLSDVIPKTTTFREYKDKKSKGVRANTSLSTGQTTLDGARSLPTRPADVMHVGEELGEEVDISPDGTGDEYLAKDGRETAPHSNRKSSYKHHKSKEHLDRDGSQDVEMS